MTNNESYLQKILNYFDEKNKEISDELSKLNLATFLQLLNNIFHKGVKSVEYGFSMIGDAIYDKIQNKIYEDIETIKLKEKLSESEVAKLVEICDSFISIIIDFFYSFFDALKEEYKQFNFSNFENILQMFSEGNIFAELDIYSSKINELIKDKLYNTVIKKITIKHPDIQVIIDNINQNLGHIFNEIIIDFLKKMFGDVILMLPTMIIGILVSIIPSPLPTKILSIIENCADKAIDKFLFLFLNTLSKIEKNIDKVSSKVDKVSSKIDKTINVQGGKKIITKNKYTKKYYLKRIHNTIRNFYKTNKPKMRFHKR
jgi:hypothetical protein